MSEEQQKVIQEELGHKIEGLFERESPLARDVYKPIDHQALQSYLLIRILDTLEDISAQLKSIDSEIWVRNNP